MIKIDNSVLEVYGTPMEVVRDWTNITYYICEKLSKETDTEVTVEMLLSIVKSLTKETK